MSCRFSYVSYVPYVHRIPQPLCCDTLPMTAETLSTLSTLSTVTNNSKGATSQTYLQFTTLRTLQDQRQQAIEAHVSTLLGQSTLIQRDLERQQAAQVEVRYQPYRPFIPEFIPSSVMELEMRTRNVGVPVPTMTIANCKGVQFVTR